jgi:DNA repair protein RecO (recombination protein O)
MGNRNHVFDALVLRRWPIGDAHRGVGFLTREHGPLSAIAHGAAASKGRLKLLTIPIRRVVLKAYHDPVADSWKVVDLEPVDLYGGLSEDLDRSAVASTWAELLWKTQSPGQPSEVFELFAEGLSLLEHADRDTVARLNVQVLWRGLELSGLAPDFSACADCGDPLREAFLLESGEAVCGNCAHGRGTRLEASAVDLLLATSIMPLGESVLAPVSPADAQVLTGEAVAAWERMLGSPLKSVRVFQGGPA